MLTTITFLTAWLGYLGVTTAMLSRYSDNKKLSRWVVPVMLTIVITHVLLVWWVRYGFDPSKAIAGGLPPAILLHFLFLMILSFGALHNKNKFFARLIYLSWILVTFLGMPGPFFLDELNWLRIPMTLTLITGIIGLIIIRRNQKGKGLQLKSN